MSVDFSLPSFSLKKSVQDVIHSKVGMPRKPALIFDLGGVLLDWNPHNVFLPYFDGDLKRVNNFLEEIDFYTWNTEQDKGRSFSDGVAELSARFPHYRHIIRAYDENWEGSVRGTIQPSVDILLPLKNQGYQLFGLTNFSSEKYQLVAKRFVFLELFEKILVSGNVKLVKPDLRIYNKILDYIGRPAWECVFIDDSPANVDAARRLNMRAILFTSSSQLQADLEQLDDFQTI